MHTSSQEYLNRAFLNNFFLLARGEEHKEAKQDQVSSPVESVKEEEKEEEKEEDKEDDEEQLESEGWAVFKADGVEFQINLKERLEKMRKDKDAEKEDDEDVERYFIGESGPKADQYSRFLFNLLYLLFCCCSKRK